MVSAVTFQRARALCRLAWAVVVMCSATPAAASIIAVTLGNAAPGFADGSTPDLIADIIPAQTGQPAPFDQGLGADPFLNGSALWTFSYGAIGSAINSASVTIGIIDHDSAATGDQVGSFNAAGSNQTGALNGLFNASGGSDGEYNVYTLALPAAVFPTLAGGTAEFSLDLTGPGLQFNILTSAVEESENNGFFLIFSTLTINTSDTGSGPPGVPEPGTMPLLALGGLALLAIASRRRIVAPARNHASNAS